ncbi:MAG TPA: alpha/beta fold hydrolase [Egibacteraceae bacterium]|nr:alpha/beta fold hydrolase [Egibacteraceae bacterium]
MEHTAHAAGGRQAAALARTLVRPRAYLGTARELAIGAFSLATYPLGMRAPVAPAPLRYAPARAEQRSLMTLAPEVAWTPIVLVHGYFHNRSAFLAMSRSLRRAGFQYVHTMNYNPLAADVPALAEQLREEVQRVLDATGAEQVQIVGHSMGGVVARTYVQMHGGDEHVDTVVSLGSPHRGTYSAHLGMGPAARQLRPGSAFLRTLESSARPGPVRWISYYSDLDAMVIPASSAKLVHPALKAVNVRTRDTGHLSLLVRGEVLRGLVGYLSDPWAGRGGAPAAGADAAAG